jgi:hypothetical protein
MLWRYDPDPAATLGLQAQIDTAVSSGVVDGASSSLGDYFCCQWSAIYVVRKPVVIGGRSLRPGDQFTLDVSVEKIPSVWGTQSRQGDVDESADRGLGGQAAGRVEGVQAVAGQFGRRDVVAEVAGLGAFGQ